MDRIESLDGSHLSRRSRRKKDKSTKQLKGRSFQSVVEQSEEYGSALLDAEDRREHRESLEELLDQVHERGDLLAEHQSLENIRTYRRAVSSFLDYVIANMIEVEEQTSGGSVLRRKRFTQLKIIDEKLEALVQGVLRNQVKQLDVLEKINEIRGLLIDLIT
jgi:uncharacterized protein YaaR (DUF327 family)